MLLILVVGVFAVWVVSGLLAYQLELRFWKRLKNLSYKQEAQVGIVFLQIGRLQIPIAPNFRMVTEYQSGNAEIHRTVVNRALTSAIMGPIGLADALYARYCYDK